MALTLLERGQHLFGDLLERRAGGLPVGALLAALLAPLVQGMLAEPEADAELPRLLTCRWCIDLLQAAQPHPHLLAVALKSERPAAAVGAGAQPQVEAAAVVQGALPGPILALADAPQGQRIDAVKRL